MQEQKEGHEKKKWEEEGGVQGLDENERIEHDGAKAKGKVMQWRCKATL